MILGDLIETLTADKEEAGLALDLSSDSGDMGRGVFVRRGGEVLMHIQSVELDTDGDIVIEVS